MPTDTAEVNVERGSDLNPSRTVLDELKKLVQQSSHYLLGLLGGLALGFISFPVFTRAFSVADYGLIDYVQKILLVVAALGKAGMQNSALRFYNRETFSADPTAARRYYSTMLLSVGGAGMLLALLFPFLIRLLPTSIVDAPLAAILSFASVLIVLRVMQPLLWSFLRIQERTKACAIAGLIIKGASVVVIILLLKIMGPSVKTYYTGTIAVELCVVAAFCFPLFRGGLVKPGSFDSTLFRAGVAFGAPLIVQELAGLILDSGDRAMVRIYLGDNPLGLYAVAYGLASYVNTLLYTPLGLAILPIYMRIWNKEGREKTIEFVSFGLDTFLMAAGGLFAIASVASGDVVKLLASSKYHGAGPLIPTLVAGLLIYTAQIFLNAGLLIHKKTFAMAATLSVSALLNIGLNIVLLPRMGLQGAALATLLSYLVSTIMLAVLASRELPLTIKLRSVGIYVIGALAAWAVPSLFELPAPIWNVILKPPCALLVYVAVLYLLDGRFRDMSGQLWRKLRNRMEVDHAVAM
jgi:O-antigen/teichoic acid export membrane protein